MSVIRSVITFVHALFERARFADGVPPLLFRLILAPVMAQAGWNKLANFDATVMWFDGHLMLPMPELLALLAGGTEFVGGILLLFGLLTRVIVIPLAFTMVVAMATVHWDHGWLAISDASSWLANERVMEAAVRKERVIGILKEHGKYEWLTARGPVTILNNGIEFAATYFVMLLSLFFTGGGRYLSADYWLWQRLRHNGLTPRPAVAAPQPGVAPRRG